MNRNSENSARISVGDLAIEILDTEAGKSLHAAAHSEYISRGCTVSHAQLDDGASYHTILSGKIWLRGDGERKRCQAVLYDILLKYLSRAGFCLHSGRVLFCGLGNAKITADALGPMICDRLLVSGGDSVYRSIGFTELYAVRPGVPAQSGIGTGDQIRVMAEHLGADLIITADAVAARTVKRLASVIQVSDSGVKAGSGAGMHSDEISSHTMPCRVISIGIPTVIRASVLVGDSLREHGITPPAYEGEEFLVSNSEVDVICECYADIVSGAVNKLFTAPLNQ